MRFANNGCLILGVCNGFQILIEAGLLPGALLRNKELKFLSKNIFVKILDNKNKFCNKYKKNQVINLNIAHNEGNFFIDKENLKKLEDQNLIAFKYCDQAGKETENSNPNGSIKNIAGIFNEKKNILGMMPHPERMIDHSISNEDGVGLFSSILS